MKQGTGETHARVFCVFDVTDKHHGIYRTPFLSCAQVFTCAPAQELEANTTGRVPIECCAKATGLSREKEPGLLRRTRLIRLSELVEGWHTHRRRSWAADECNDIRDLSFFSWCVAGLMRRVHYARTERRKTSHE